MRDARAAVDRLAAQAPEIVAVVGFPDRDAEGVHNAAAVLAGGRVVGIYHKVHLPNYGVFDEQRYFAAGRTAGVLDLGEHRIGVTICEDIWLSGPPCSDAARAGASLIVNLSASPYHAGKGLEREALVTGQARENVAAVAFCAIVGGQDELVFDGHSFVVDHTGGLLARAAQFEEELLICDVDLDAPLRARAGTAPRGTSAERDGRGVTPRARAGRGAPAAATDRAAARAGRGRDLRGARSRPARLRRKERLRARRARALGWDRLGARRDDRGRRPRPRARQRRRDAVAVLLGRHPGRRARDRRQARSRRARASDRGGHGGLRGAAGGAVRGPGPRSRRGEPAGADPRQPADGALQQVRLARPDDGQQVRDVGRLFDALR